MTVTKQHQGRALLVLLSWVLWLSSTAAVVAKTQSEPEQSPRIEERYHNLNLYKRIKTEENKKVLVQLLHDIAAIQQRCREQGYVCDLNPAQISSPVAKEYLERSPMVVEKPCAADTTPPIVKLLGIVGGRARFLLESQQVKDLAVGEQYGTWVLTNLTPETVILTHKSQPQTRLSYRIYDKKFLIEKPPSVK